MTEPLAQPLPPPRDADPDRAERVERRWAGVSVTIIVVLVAIATFAGVHQAAMPQSRVETADPRTCISVANSSKATWAARWSPTAR